MWTPRRTLLGIWVVALLVRVVYLSEISGAPFADLRVGDAEAYHEWALRIAGGEWLGRDVFYQAPLYPYFLAFIYRIAGDSTIVVRMIQAIVGASSCALLASAGISLFGLSGAVAGLLLAVYPTAIYFDGLLEKTSLVVFFTCALLAVLAVPPERFSARHGLTAGAILGLLILTRENAILLVPVVLICIWFRSSPKTPNRRSCCAPSAPSGSTYCSDLRRSAPW
jgi:4-amino-4-deoxy-L-arabinose transferase-like glycosyltransferase